VRVAIEGGLEGVRVQLHPADLAHVDATLLRPAVEAGLRARLVVTLPAADEGFAASLRLALRHLGALEGIEVRGPPTLVDADAVAAALEACARAARAHGIPLGVTAGTLPTCVLLAAMPDARVSRQLDAPPQGERFYGSCHVCAARPGCPGAPAAAWSHRGAGALDPPQVVMDPWQLEELGGIGALQSVVRADLADLPAARVALEACPAPTRWLVTPGWSPAVAALPFTHLGVELRAQHIPIESIEALARLDRAFAVALFLPSAPLDVLPIVGLLQRLGALSVALFGGESWSVLDRARLGLPPVARPRRRPPAATGDG
jgi:hypothetical protein